MLNIRNASFLRRVYIWMLSSMTKIAYWGNLRNRQPTERKIDIERVRRLNNELERGLASWKDEFLIYSKTSSRQDLKENLAFSLKDLTPFVTDGVEAIVGDTLTMCFNSSSPDPWNFLTRTAPVATKDFRPYWTLLWLVGMWVRYCFLLPVRVVVLVMGVLMFFIGFAATFVLPKAPLTIRLRKFMIRFLASAVVASWSGYVRFHGQRPKRRANQMYVANHTSLIDVFVLVKDYNFSFIGQRHGGLAGFLEGILHTTQDHVWFDREESTDRSSVSRLIKEHVTDGTKEPMLVFPEGTCTNSDYCIMFKKGSFEHDVTVYPIALKFHKRFGDPFWNSQTTTFPRHLFDLMTSWALVCDVYYLDPMEMNEGENAIQFSARVRRAICEKGGLTSLNWDGFLKRHRINPKVMKRRQQALSEVVLTRLDGDTVSMSSEEDNVTHEQVLNDAMGLDTLGLSNLMRANQAHDENRKLIADKRENEGRNRGLRRRWSRTPGGRAAENGNELLRRAENTARDVTKWVIGISMLSIAVIITWIFFPKHWIDYVTR